MSLPGQIAVHGQARTHDHESRQGQQARRDRAYGVVQAVGRRHITTTRHPAHPRETL